MSLKSISQSISQAKVSGNIGIMHTLLGTRPMMKRVQELCEKTVPYEQNTGKNDRELIVTFGDSTCIGVGASEPSRSLVGLIGTRFPEATIHNRGVIGATIESTMKQIELFMETFPKKEVGKVFLIVGGNDITDNLLTRHHTFAQKTEQKLRILLKLARAVSEDIVYITPGNLGATFGLTGILGTSTMREMITNKARVLSILAGSVGKDYNIPVSSNFREPDMDPIARDRTLAGDDGIHPSDAGYALAFERIQALL